MQNCISAGNVVFKFKLDYLITQHQGYINKDLDEHFFWRFWPKLSCLYNTINISITSQTSETHLKLSIKQFSTKVIYFHYNQFVGYQEHFALHYFMLSKCWVIYHVLMYHFMAELKLSQSFYISYSENLPLLLRDGVQTEMNDWVYFSCLADILAITSVSNFLLIEGTLQLCYCCTYFGQVLSYNKPANLNYVNSPV